MGIDASKLIADDEAALIRASRTGCRRSFGLLVQHHQQRVYRVIYRLVNHPDDAEELTQETFLRAYAKLDSFSGACRFYTWLFRIGTNLALSHRRRKRVVKFQPIVTGGDSPTERGVDQQAELAGRRQTRPDQAAQKKDIHRKLAEALAGLDEEYRPAIVLRDIEQMSYNEIADVLELPVGTVKSRIHRGRLILRDQLKSLTGPEQ